MSADQTPSLEGAGSGGPGDTGSATVVPELFTYGGGSFLWGYSADRQFCGIWPVENPVGPGEIWPISQHAQAWVIYREREPLAVNYAGPQPQETLQAQLEASGASGASGAASAAGFGSAPGSLGLGSGLSEPAQELAGGSSLIGSGGASGSEASSPLLGSEQAAFGIFTHSTGPSAVGYGAHLPKSAAASGELLGPDLAVSKSARTILIVSIIIGLILAITDIAVVANSSKSNNTSNHQAEAYSKLNSAYKILSSGLQQYESDANACPQSSDPLTCVTSADEVAERAFSAFGIALSADHSLIPQSDSFADENLVGATNQVQNAFATLASSSSDAQYASNISAVSIKARLARFQNTFDSLDEDLQPLNP